jgi:hypothetical protein
MGRGCSTEIGTQDSGTRTVSRTQDCTADRRDCPALADGLTSSVLGMSGAADRLRPEMCPSALLGLRLHLED